jgi:hypothetical protein
VKFREIRGGLGAAAGVRDVRDDGFHFIIFEVHHGSAVASIRIVLAGYKQGMHWRSHSPVQRPPRFIEPFLRTNGHDVPTGPQWAYEIKHDGCRFMCRLQLDRVRVFVALGQLEFTGNQVYLICARAT